MVKNKNCYSKYKEIRKEWWYFIFIILLFIPLTLFAVYYIKPRIEKVYIVKFSQTFTINEFTISTFNYTDALFYDINVNEDNYTQQYYIDKISFGFHNWKDQYTSNEYLNAIIYRNYSTINLDNNIETGNYIIREFELENQTLESLKSTYIRFKIPHVFQLFYINIHILSIFDKNCSAETNFYHFFTTIYDQRVSQTDILINTLLFYNEYYIYPTYSFYPYTITVATNIDYESVLPFDLSFR